MAKTKKGQEPQPEQSQETTPTVSPWVRTVTSHIKEIGWGLAVIVLIAAVYTGYTYYTQRTLRNAQQQVDQILTQKSGKARISALEAYLPQAPDSMHTSLHLHLARICLQEQAFDQAQTHWEYIRQNTEDRDLKIVAALGLATALAGQDKTPQALDLLDEVQAKAPERYKRSLNLKIATLAEEVQNWERALSAYETIQQMTDLTANRDDYIAHKISVLQDKVHSANS